ncbi:type I glutamate--ammonia ligase [Legionella longbeachae]|uniref:Glutamine synthetase n=1 Tax=Legionella longbeachae serogroup 1 (strain NSW150) TaxID=661367 RepID=D3HSC8_LEGLN|nr:type I glutamate--ammonia ligase [Legionella longbeachae]VEE02312.1 glutamine synthetase [Legionella oakridgensis]HBD7398196.1 type I glutamate--ammonia ligase [Legionella pneumophila]ARB91400.1 type I glutamate--ammonia ligase [Legionella longbeachae]ARM32173.1 type I glutamate--ammonia ligase [Legionella longbeachae]EEZ95047.1 glutamine synthetase type I [Legionella longbeachae D-4968]
MSKNTILEAIKEHEAKLIDLRFTDIRGKEQHITIPVSAVDNDFVENGKMIDGSSFKGWQKIHQSDLALIPDLETIKLDPFFQDNTLFIRCNVVDPKTMMGYERCPRSLALRAEAYLQSTGIADTAFFGPEPEFFIFDSVQWETNIGGAFYKIDSEEAQWYSGKELEGGNIGHRPGIKGGYFPVPPVDSSHDIRSAMCLTLESLGTIVEAHHHEVATANQCEIATRFNTLTKKADELQILKYVVHNVAHNYGKTATFMPKPLVGDNGSGMHCHQSLSKDGVNLFSGDQYAGLSETALYYIGGIIKHARALNAFTNPATNSYKRLVPGFEAPVLLAYSARNRSAAIRIPHVNNPKARRIEIRFPDPTANPYLAFSAMMMAGLDGIQRKIHPGQAMDKDLYDLPPEELVDIPTVCSSLEQSMEHLKMDHEFLLQGDVFSKDFIMNYINMKEEETSRIRSLTHPYEFELYYSL